MIFLAGFPRFPAGNRISECSKDTLYRPESNLGILIQEKWHCEKIIHSAFISLASAGFHRLVTSDGV